MTVGNPLKVLADSNSNNNSKNKKQTKNNLKLEIFI